MNIMTTDEESALDWDGVTGHHTCSLIFPVRSHKISILLLSLLAGAITFLSCVTLRSVQSLERSSSSMSTGLSCIFEKNLFITFCLRYEVIKIFFPDTSISVLVMISSWLTVFISLQSLITITPPETASWRHVVNTDLQASIRPLVLLLCQTCVCVGLYFWNIFSISNIFYVIISLLPLFWFLGILPPPDTFILWSGEQILIFCFGGSPASTNLQLLLHLILASCQLLLVTLIRVSNDSLVIIATVSGYILSTHWTGVFTINCRNKVKDISVAENKTNTQDVKNKEAKLRSQKSISRAVLLTQEILIHICVFGISLALSILIPRVSSSSIMAESSSVTETSSSSESFSVLGWVIIIWTIIIKILHEVNKVYSLFGLIRSPLYISSTSKTLSSSIIKIIIRFIHPVISGLLLLVYILQVVKNSPQDSGFMIILHNLGTQRSLRWIWQNTDSALIETAIFHLVKNHLHNMITEHSLPVLLNSSILQLVMISFFFSRLCQCLEKLYLVLSLTATSVEDRASRRSYAFIMFQMNLFMFPVIFFMIIITSLISAPLLSIFTLPVFFLTYPR